MDTQTQAHSQQQSEVARTSEPLAASGLTSASRGSLLMPAPQGVHAPALASENMAQPGRKLPGGQAAMAAPAAAGRWYPGGTTHASTACAPRLVVTAPPGQGAQ
jgi:hypothetical protein